MRMQMVFCGVLACCIQLHGMEQKKNNSQSLQNDDQVRHFPEKVCKTIEEYVGFEQYHYIHTGYASAFALSHDAKYVAAAGTDGYTISLWDVATRKKVHTLLGHTDTIQAVVFSPDGSQLASGGWDRSVRLWDCNTGELIRTYEGHSKLVSALMFSPDGSMLASSSWDDSIWLWDSKSHTKKLTIARLPNQVNKMEFTPNGQQLVTIDCEDKARLWSCTTGEEEYSCVAADVTRSLDGSCRALANKKTVSWQRAQDQLSRKIQFPHNIERLALSPDGNFIAGVSDASGLVYVADCKKGKIVQRILHEKVLSERLSVFFRHQDAYRMLAIAGAGWVTFYRRLCLPVCKDVPIQIKQEQS
jgi:WD40 repeat protein